MEPGHYIGGGQRLTDDDFDRINADIREEPRGRWAGWALLGILLCCCAFWYAVYQWVCSRVFSSSFGGFLGG